LEPSGSLQACIGSDLPLSMFQSTRLDPRLDKGQWSRDCLTPEDETENLSRTFCTLTINLQREKSQKSVDFNLYVYTLNAYYNFYPILYVYLCTLNLLLLAIKTLLYQTTKIFIIDMYGDFEFIIGKCFCFYFGPSPGRERP